MAVLAEKWTLLVVTQLANGPMRTAEIRRGVDGVSEKMLIQTLRKLEGFGLVSRKAYPEVPPRVEYKLTALGRSLARLAGLFGRWVERNAVSWALPIFAAVELAAGDDAELASRAF